MPLNPCDLVEVGAKAYADGAKALETFGKEIKRRYGEQLSPEVMQGLFRKAADRYRTDYTRLEEIKNQMAHTVVEEARKGRTPGQKFGEAALNVSSIPRSIMASSDFSMTFRQALALTTAHPGIAGRAFVDQARAMFGSRKYGISGERWAQQVHDEILNRPNAPLYEEAGLFLSPLEKGEAMGLLGHEEAFQSTLAEKIPGVKHVLKGSDRAAVTYLNKMRADVFDDLIRRADPGDGSLPIEQAREIAKFVNIASGRGELPAVLNGSAKLLSTVFFSPKLAMSRIEYMAGPGKLAIEAIRTKAKGGNLTPAQKIVATEYARTVGAVVTVLSLAKAAGATVETDPRSSDFLKIKVGNTRYDVLGGMGQYMVLLSRLAKGETISSTGKVKELGGSRFQTSTRGEIVTRFIRGKLSPVVGLGADVLAKQKSKDYPPSKQKYPHEKQIGSDFIGRPVTPASAAQNMFLPMIANGFAQSLTEGEGVPKSLANAIAEWVGFGVSTYKPGDPRVPNQDITDLFGITGP